MAVISVKGLAVLCAFLSLQTPAFGALTKLTRVTRELLPDTNDFLLTAEFEADSKPEARWFLFNGSYLLPPGSSVTYGRDPKHPQSGTASLRVNREDRRYGSLYLSLGDLHSQYLDLLWNMSGTEDMSLALDFAMSTVIPGERLQVTFSVEEDRGKEELHINYGYHVYVVLSGDYHNAATDQFIIDGAATEFIWNSYKRQNGVSTTTIDFLTDQYTMNGIFRGSVSGAVNAINTPLIWVSEFFVVKVHEEKNKGPFPDGTVVANFGNNIAACTSEDDECLMICTAYGNELDSVEIYKENANGEREQQNAYEIGVWQFKRRAELRVDHKQLGFETKFVCKATLTDGKEAEDAATLYVLGN